MKGPRSRHRFNVQRVWECPACLTRAFAPPQVVTRTCGCQGKEGPVSMRLLEASRVRVKKSADNTDQPGA